MSDTKNMAFETLQIHAGSAPDPATGARQTPIYQTTAFAFRDADHAAKLFNLEEIGYIYSRLTNPTVSALQDRVTALEGGAGAVACSSGHAAQIMALFPLLHAGDNIVVSPRLYGGTVTQFSQSISTIWRRSVRPPTTRLRRSSWRASPTPGAMSATSRRLRASRMS